MRIVEKDGQFHLQGVGNFDLALTLDCGQCFRWEICPDGFWQGVVKGKFCRVRQQKSTLVFTHTDRKTIRRFWIPYFSLDRDYAALCRDFSCDEVLCRAVAFAPGIRVLRQDPWETLCSFIISQNNNIPRIKGIIHRLCELLGEDIGAPMKAFPSPQALAACTAEDLSPLRAGFRAKYLLDAAKKVADGSLPLDTLKGLDTENAREMLMTVYGVGKKVADCVLLYSLEKYEVIPLDVWMKRVVSQYYPNGFPPHLAKDLGIAQQYLFHYVRCHGDEIK